MNDNDLQNLKQNIEEVREITERNHEMLKSIERSLFWKRVMSIIYWVIIIGVAVGAFYFLQPYIDRVLDVYGQVQKGLNAIPSAAGK